MKKKRVDDFDERFQLGSFSFSLNNLMMKNTTIKSKRNKEKKKERKGEEVKFLLFQHI